jgi:DNA-binding MarR family transcriptional regulator
MAARAGDPSDADAAAAMGALRRIVRYLRLAERDVEGACGVSVAQLFVLRQLADTPAISLGELAAQTLTDPSSVSTVVARLVARGLVARRPAPGDRRRAELRLTEPGYQLARTAPPAPQAQLIDAIRAMAPGRRAALVRSLEGLAAAIGADEVAPRMLFEDEAATAETRSGRTGRARGRLRRRGRRRCPARGARWSARAARRARRRTARSRRDRARRCRTGT